jgi:hypothetical protein
VNRSSMVKVENGKTWVGLEIIWKLAEAEPAELLRAPPRQGGRYGRQAIGWRGMNAAISYTARTLACQPKALSTL